MTPFGAGDQDKKICRGKKKESVKIIKRTSDIGKPFPGCSLCQLCVSRAGVLLGCEAEAFLAAKCILGWAVLPFSSAVLTWGGEMVPPNEVPALPLCSLGCQGEISASASLVTASCC